MVDGPAGDMVVRGKGFTVTANEADGPLPMLELWPPQSSALELGRILDLKM